MRNFIFAATAAVVLGSVSVVQADDNEINLGGVVPPNCNVSGLSGSFDFPSLTVGASNTFNVSLLCNDGDGAVLSMSSSEGGLESDDVEDAETEYTAVLSNTVISGGSLTLDTTGQGNNDITVTTTLDPSNQLAGGNGGSLEVTLLETAVHAGGYSDTLKINITAL